MHNPRYRGLFLRREAKYLHDAIEKSDALYPKLGAKRNGSTNTWTFPSGAQVWLNHCQHENDIANYDSLEFAEIIFEELTHFTERQYVGLCARIRGTDPTLPYWVRGTCNPGGIGGPWVFKRWGAWLDPKASVRALPGELLSFVGDAREPVPPGTADALTRTFIPAKLADNPHVANGYRAQLLSLDPVRRAQLLEGDWLKKAAPKDLWDRSKVPHLERAPRNSEVRARVRCWDFAASEADDADWTVGMLASITYENVVTLEHMERFRGTPAKVRARFKATAAADRERDPRTVQYIPQDPGQAGVDQVHSYQVENPGIAIRSRRPTGDKIVRFGPASGRGLAGNLPVVRGPWNEAMHDELEEAPEGPHDDAMDAVSDAVAVLTGDVPAEFSEELATAQVAPLRTAERADAFMAFPDDDADDYPDDR